MQKYVISMHLYAVSSQKYENILKNMQICVNILAQYAKICKQDMQKYTCKQDMQKEGQLVGVIPKEVLKEVGSVGIKVFTVIKARKILTTVLNLFIPVIK